MPVSDWAGECCCAAVRAVWLEQLLVRGSSWGQQLEGKSQEEQGEVGQRFLEQCGAKPTSRGLSVRSLAEVLARPLQRLSRLQAPSSNTPPSAEPGIPCVPECGLEVVQRASITVCWIPHRSKNGTDVTDSTGRRCIVVVMVVVVVVVVFAIVFDAASPICYLLYYPFSAI